MKNPTQNICGIVPYSFGKQTAKGPGKGLFILR
jgi:hypothetical protein